MATDTAVYSSRWGEALKVNKLTFDIRAFDSSWHPGLPGRPLLPGRPWPPLAPLFGLRVHRGTKNKTAPPLGSYRMPMPRVLGWSWGDGRFLMREVPLYINAKAHSALQRDLMNNLEAVDPPALRWALA